MDADGIPLSIYSHWQKALLWDMMCGQWPRITMIGSQPTISG